MIQKETLNFYSPRSRIIKSNSIIPNKTSRLDYFVVFIILIFDWNMWMLNWTEVFVLIQFCRQVRSHAIDFFFSLRLLHSLSIVYISRKKTQKLIERYPATKHKKKEKLKSNIDSLMLTNVNHMSKLQFKEKNLHQTKPWKKLIRLLGIFSTHHASYLLPSLVTIFYKW